jgi:hypothetical protein
MQALNDLTDLVFQHIANEQWNKIDTVLTQRHQCINKLMSLHSNETHDQLTKYVTVIRRQDAEIMRLMQEQSDHIKSHLSQVDKTKEYVIG